MIGSAKTGTPNRRECTCCSVPSCIGSNTMTLGLKHLQVPDIGASGWPQGRQAWSIIGRMSSWNRKTPFLQDRPLLLLRRGNNIPGLCAALSRRGQSFIEGDPKTMDGFDPVDRVPEVFNWLGWMDAPTGLSEQRRGALRYNEGDPPFPKPPL